MNIIFVWIVEDKHFRGVTKGGIMSFANSVGMILLYSAIFIYAMTFLAAISAKFFKEEIYQYFKKEFEIE